jgi:hypothetical protein
MEGKPRTQRLVPRDDGAETSLEGVQIERARQPGGYRDVIGAASRLPLIQEPEASLAE